MSFTGGVSPLVQAASAKSQTVEEYAEDMLRQNGEEVYYETSEEEQAILEELASQFLSEERALAGGEFASVEEADAAAERAWTMALQERGLLSDEEYIEYEDDYEYEYEEEGYDPDAEKAWREALIAQGINPDDWEDSEDEEMLEDEAERAFQAAMRGQGLAQDDDLDAELAFQAALREQGLISEISEEEAEAAFKAALAAQGISMDDLQQDEELQRALITGTGDKEQMKKAMVDRLDNKEENLEIEDLFSPEEIANLYRNTRLNETELTDAPEVLNRQRWELLKLYHSYKQQNKIDKAYSDLSQQAVAMCRRATYVAPDNPESPLEQYVCKDSKGILKTGLAPVEIERRLTLRATSPEEFAALLKMQEPVKSPPRKRRKVNFTLTEEQLKIQQEKELDMLEEMEESMELERSMELEKGGVDKTENEKLEAEKQKLEAEKQQKLEAEKQKKLEAEKQKQQALEKQKELEKKKQQEQEKQQEADKQKKEEKKIQKKEEEQQKEAEKKKAEEEKKKKEEEEKKKKEEENKKTVQPQPQPQQQQAPRSQQRVSVVDRYTQSLAQKAEQEREKGVRRMDPTPWETEAAQRASIDSSKVVSSVSVTTKEPEPVKETSSPTIPKIGKSLGEQLNADQVRSASLLPSPGKATPPPLAINRKSSLSVGTEDNDPYKSSDALNELQKKFMEVSDKRVRTPRVFEPKIEPDAGEKQTTSVESQKPPAAAPLNMNIRDRMKLWEQKIETAEREKEESTSRRVARLKLKQQQAAHAAEERRLMEQRKKAAEARKKRELVERTRRETMAALRRQESIKALKSLSTQSILITNEGQEGGSTRARKGSISIKVLSEQHNAAADAASGAVSASDVLGRYYASATRNVQSQTQRMQTSGEKVQIIKKDESVDVDAQNRWLQYLKEVEDINREAREEAIEKKKEIEEQERAMAKAKAQQEAIARARAEFEAKRESEKKLREEKKQKKKELQKKKGKFFARFKQKKDNDPRSIWVDDESDSSEEDTEKPLMDTINSLPEVTAKKPEPIKRPAGRGRGVRRPRGGGRPGARRPAAGERRVRRPGAESSLRPARNHNNRQSARQAPSKLKSMARTNIVERQLCPEGIMCTSNDPEHFLKFQHTSPNPDVERKLSEKTESSPVITISDSNPSSQTKTDSTKPAQSPKLQKKESPATRRGSDKDSKSKKRDSTDSDSLKTPKKGLPILPTK